MEELPQWVQDLMERGYMVDDISMEEQRTVYTGDTELIIYSPQWLVRRPGGSTHRVVNSVGQVYCYRSPELSGTIIVWTVREGRSPIAF